MRLLDTTSFELRNGEQPTFRQEGYAILSHRWTGVEITFEELKSHTAELRTAVGPLSSPQADKIRGACETARNQGIKWMWIDTCCINKASATEESESINSMFKWYREARLCIAYLSDVKINGRRASSNIFKRIYNDEPSEWFFRGWTLQELLAPPDMQFYDMDWTYIGTKTDLAGSIARITGIETRYLIGTENFGEACIAAKMSWMAQRTTTREEDMAYSMVGIFGITMTPQYGEGQGAFMRLQEILLSTYRFDESLFAWKMPEPNAGAKFGARKDQWAAGEWGLLAASPEWFEGSGDILTIADQPGTRNFVMTPQGLRAPIQRPLYTGKIKTLDNLYGVLWTTFIGTIPAIIGFKYHIERLLNEKAKEDFAFALNCYRRNTGGKLENVEIYLRPTNVETVRYKHKVLPISFVAKRIRCNDLGLSLSSIIHGGERIVLQPRPSFPGRE
ncbi:heterokaryon incompatibility protein-domain-containing protein [Nemania abortiva]|nr:heterokaryon incompatibility protein-domain-containing protein [Nemania abortiva]